MFLLHCPISGGCDTKITKHSFINACLKYQEYMGTKVALNGTRKRDFTEVCEPCTIREAVKNGKPFKPPRRISFIPLTYHSMPEKKTTPKKTTPKKTTPKKTTPKKTTPKKTYDGLIDKDVNLILQLLARKHRQKDIALQFKVKPQLIKRIKKDYKDEYEGL